MLKHERQLNVELRRSGGSGGHSAAARESNDLSQHRTASHLAFTSWVVSDYELARSARVLASAGTQADHSSPHPHTLTTLT